MLLNLRFQILVVTDNDDVIASCAQFTSVLFVVGPLLRLVMDRTIAIDAGARCVEKVRDGVGIGHLVLRGIGQLATTFE